MPVRVTMLAIFWLMVFEFIFDRRILMHGKRRSVIEDVCGRQENNELKHGAESLSGRCHGLFELLTQTLRFASFFPVGHAVVHLDRRANRQAE